jgi:hypothetical protein
MVAYQFLYCYSMTNGDMTGLFMTSSRARHPPGFSSGFLYRDSGGYDGQFYRILAHDPLDRKEYWSYLDNPRYRSRRILIPAVAAVLGGGSSGAVDFWYVAVTDILLALGGLCFIRLAEDSCSRLAAAAMYLVIPAVTASTDRMVLDGPSLAGFLALWLFVKEDRKWAAWTVLILLPLIREAGLVFTAGAWIVWLQRRDRWGLLVGAVTPLPALAWWWYAALHTGPSGAGGMLSTPLIPQVMRLFTPVSRPVSRPENLLLQSLDLVGLVCLLIAFALTCRAVIGELRRGHMEEDTLIILPAAILAAVSSGPSILSEPYAFLRVNSAMLTWAALRLLAMRSVFSWAYVAACSLPLLIFRVSPILRFAGVR